TYYATTCRECAAGCGMHIRVREGRAVKAEGNPESPVNRGRLCARGQASLQGLYNPDRIRQPMRRGANGAFEPISWDEAIQELVSRLGAAQGQGIKFVTGNENGSFSRLIDQWLQAFGSDGRVPFEPFAYEAIRAANEAVFGVEEIPDVRFEDAKYVLSFGADFLETWMSPVEFTTRFTDSHSVNDNDMGRFVHIEPRMSLTGQNADEWIAPNPGTEGILALGVANVVLADHGANAPSDVYRVRDLLERFDPETVEGATGVEAATVRRLAEEFTANPSVAVAGGIGNQHDQAHVTAAAVNILNYVAGNVGRTVVFGPGRHPAGEGSYRALADLVTALGQGEVEVLLVHGVNPVHTSPAQLGVKDAIGQAGYVVSFARVMDETAAEANLILPDHDPLEQWNDFEPKSGTYALQQPVMQPVFDTRQSGDVLLQVAQAAGNAGRNLTQASFKEYLQSSWQARQNALGGGGQSFEVFWNEALRAGGVHQDVRVENVRLRAGVEQLEVGAWSKAETTDGLALIAYPSSVFYDGRNANRPWLQELPDPVSKVTWSSWVEIHPDTAEELGVVDGDFVEVASDAGSIQAPVWTYPGIKPGVVAVPIGQGHKNFGRYATDRGANVYDVLAADATVFGGLSHYQRVTVTATGEHEYLATNAGRSRQMGRGIAQATTIAHVKDHDIHHFHVAHAAPVPEKMEAVIEEWQHAQDEEQKQGNYAGDHPRWGMSIDLTRCTGCSACVTACHAENNIPTVGKEAVQRGRDMAWIRIERYFEGGEHGEPLSVEILPMMCQQCGRAPCEPVCPVFAAYHTSDGLNAQIYNRCVGTRYCANNCPYKVRYYNWWDHALEGDPFFAFDAPLDLQLNPDVAVRTKGVMEKCTFCVQRIRGKQNQAVMEDREVADGEIQTACQQGCPADAIVFGDLNDPSSAVSRMKQSDLSYRVLEGLNTDPGVTYQMKVRNTVEA
ncbi:MAG: molybdopterin-dependent oxidoreductase, partial [Gemmatimonadota bacterium]|nr:molybdopterin-dependent oxidoreductase [Gemmatimonadota bacterium]